MRKIETKADVARRKKRNGAIIGIVLLAVLVLSTVGFAIQSQDPTANVEDEGQSGYVYNYNGYDFVLHSSGLWILTLGDSQFGFRNLPTAIDGLEGISVNSLSSYAGKALYISSENIEAETEIYRTLDGVILRRQYACLEGEECLDESYPVKTCQDNFIIIKEDTLSTIIQEDNCVYILGPREDLPKLADEFLYKAIGVEY